jgi:hypothetical protein
MAAKKPKGRKILLPLRPVRGENSPNQSSRFEPLNPLTRRDATLSPTGGEGRVRGRSGGGEVHGEGWGEVS